MNCPYCMNKVSAFSTRCEHCTSEYNAIYLWTVNFIAWIVAIVVFFAVIVGLTFL